MAHLFVREYNFAPDEPTWIYHKPKGGKWTWEKTAKKRSWRADFACIGGKLLMECDGSSFTFGRHNRGTNAENGNVRTAMANDAGWEILRVTRRMIEETVAADLIIRALNRRLPQWKQTSATD